MPQVVGQNESTAFYSLQLLHILKSDKIMAVGHMLSIAAADSAIQGALWHRLAVQN